MCYSATAFFVLRVRCSGVERGGLVINERLKSSRHSFVVLCTRRVCRPPKMHCVFVLPRRLHLVVSLPHYFSTPLFPSVFFHAAMSSSMRSLLFGEKRRCVKLFHTQKHATRSLKISLEGAKAIAHSITHKGDRNRRTYVFGVGVQVMCGQERRGSVCET